MALSRSYRRPRRLRIAFLAAAAALAALAPAGTTAQPAKRANWSATITETAGGHLLGNPAAEVKLVEFMSYTCSHCADFAREGDGAIKLGYVPSGRLSYEIRHLVRDPVDLTAALLASCGPAGKFFANHAAIMARQPEWMGKARAATQAQRARWSFGTTAARFQAIASDLGFDDLMVGRGYTRADITKCLSDEAKARAIAATSQADTEALGLRGTPSFVLDGVLLEGVHNWPSLQPRLDALL